VASSQWPVVSCGPGQPAASLPKGLGPRRANPVDFRFPPAHQQKARRMGTLGHRLLLSL
jgi:hypothetical protein